MRPKFFKKTPLSSETPLSFETPLSSKTPLLYIIQNACRSLLCDRSFLKRPLCHSRPLCHPRPLCYPRPLCHPNKTKRKRNENEITRNKGKKAGPARRPQFPLATIPFWDSFRTLFGRLRRFSDGFGRFSDFVMDDCFPDDCLTFFG